MGVSVIEMGGTVRPDGTLALDAKVNLPAGRVRVTVQSMEMSSDAIDVLQHIHAEQAASGHIPRNREQIDAEIAAMRQEDEERMKQLERLHEDCQQAQ